MDKRAFLKSTAVLGLSFSSTKLAWGTKKPTIKPHADYPNDEAFWKAIRANYQLNSSYINLENGYYCIQPQEVLNAYMNHIKDVNEQGAYYMRTVQFDNKKKVSKALSELAGCQADELIITRNTTESLDMIIAGYPWQQGDEAIMANQDYGAMLDMFNQVSKRHGIVNKIIDIPLHPKSDDDIVKLYEDAITEKTKLIMVCHMINITGQVLPIKKIIDMAHRKHVEVMVDGAHAFAHLDFKLSDLNCDYYGCSLHKWLSVPLGAGFLYVNKKHIHKIWPLLAETNLDSNDIARLNHTGTIPVHTDLSILDAIEFYNKIGAKRKEYRLRYLQEYWTKPLREIDNIIINTPAESQRACGIANVGIKGISPAELAEKLFKNYNIYTVAIDGKGVKGCRITPNVYTSTEELDALIKALKELAGGK